MRIALFGGSFDPPHRGHVALARLAIDRLHLDRVLIAPVGCQPLKHATATASFEDRMIMARLAFSGDSRIEISGADAPLPDGRPNYTVETILRLKQTRHPNDELFCLMGVDSWLTIGKWYRAPELLVSCDFIVGARPGFDLARIPRALPSGIHVADQESGLTGCILWRLTDTTGLQSRLYVLPDLAEDVSATEVRAELGHHSNASSTREAPLDPEVVKYIRGHNLYGIGADRKASHRRI